MAGIRVLAIDQGRGVWGAQNYLLRLAPQMAELGVQLVFAGPAEHELHQAWRATGLESLHMEVPVERSVRRNDELSMAALAREGARSRALAKLIANAARDGDFDVIWANSHWGHLDSAIAGRLSGKPTVLHLHEEVTRGFSTWLRAAAVAIAHRTVAVSAAVAAGLPSPVQTRMCVIPNGVDINDLCPASDRHVEKIQRMRAELNLSDGDIMVFAATRLDPSKRIEDLLSALGSVTDRRVRLVVAGSSSGYPEYETSVRARATEPDCAGRVVFCGPRNDVPDLLRASQVFLHAGLIEGMPLGVLEAQSCGVPVVAYSVAGVPESVRDGETGFLARPGDPLDLARQLQKIIELSDVRVPMGEAARANIVANHDIVQQVSRNVAIIEAMCSGARASAS